MSDIVEQNDTDGSKKAGSRTGKKFIGGYFDPAVHMEIKMLAAKESKTTQELVAEAVTMLFQSRKIDTKVIA
jgi:hypothetical protein